MDEGYDLQSTADGGYVIAGRTASYGEGGYDIYVVKTNPKGEEEWTAAIGGPQDEQANAVQQTVDGGYIIAGSTESFGLGGRDACLVKLSHSGNVTWLRTFGGPAADEAFSVALTGDGGYVLAGQTSSFGAGNTDAYLIKTDDAGDEIWTRTFGGPQQDRARCVRETQDGGYILAGNTRSFAAAHHDVYLIKTNAAGDEDWTRVFVRSGVQLAHSVRQTDDGGYIVAGELQARKPGAQRRDTDVFLIKTDGLGIQEWTQTVPGTQGDAARSVIQTSDGGYLISGHTFSFSQHIVYLDPDGLLLKTDSAGTLQWVTNYGTGAVTDSGNLFARGSATGQGDVASSVIEKVPGVYAFVGSTQSFGAKETDVWLVQLRPFP